MSKLRILAIHGIGWDKEKKKEKATDIWRIARPIQELKKHSNWQIDEQPTPIPEMDKYKDFKEFTPDELEKAVVKLGKYDIIWSMYFTNPSFYTMFKVVQARYGTKFVMDIDDDLFSIKLDNPIWMKLTDENVYHMQCMARDVDYISTTTEELAETLRSKRPDKPAESVLVIPNLIPETYKQRTPNNKHLTIGYFGGSSHIFDIDNSGMVEAVERLMHENKDIRFVSCGIPIEKYLPKGRYTYLEGMPGTDWVEKMFPRLNFDIALAPLEECLFADGKSNIKFLESTRMGAAFVASNTGPYKHLKNGVNAMLVNNNSEEWYNAIKKLIESKKLRDILVEEAKKVVYGLRLETKWTVMEDMFNKLNSSGDKNDNQPSKKSIILQTAGETNSDDIWISSAGRSS